MDVKSKSKNEEFYSYVNPYMNSNSYAVVETKLSKESLTACVRDQNK